MSTGTILLIIVAVVAVVILPCLVGIILGFRAPVTAWVRPMLLGAAMVLGGKYFVQFYVRGRTPFVDIVVLLGMLTIAAGFVIGCRSVVVCCRMKRQQKQRGENAP